MVSTVLRLSVRMERSMPAIRLFMRSTRMAPTKRRQCSVSILALQSCGHSGVEPVASLLPLLHLQLVAGGGRDVLALPHRTGWPVRRGSEYHRLVSRRQNLSHFHFARNCACRAAAGQHADYPHRLCQRAARTCSTSSGSITRRRPRPGASCRPPPPPPPAPGRPARRQLSALRHRAGWCDRHGGEYHALVYHHRRPVDGGERDRLPRRTAAAQYAHHPHRRRRRAERTCSTNSGSITRGHPGLEPIASLLLFRHCVWTPTPGGPTCSPSPRRMASAARK